MAESQFAYEVTCKAMADGWENSERHQLPDHLEEIGPGIHLAAVLASVDPTKLNGHDAVRLMQAEARLSSHHEARKLLAMSEVAFSPPGNANSPVERDGCEIDYVATEIAAALTLTRRASETELSRAVSLTGRLRRVWSAFAAGEIDLQKVKVFDSHLGHLPEETIAEVLDHTLSEAPGLTTGQLRALVSRRVLIADPDGSAASLEAGLADRKVTAHGNPDHTGSFHILNGDPAAVAAARAHVEKLARRLKTRGEDRTLDELRADVALDLLRGRHVRNQGGGQGRVHVTIPAATLLEVSDEPGELDGYGPVIGEIARKTVRENVDGEWVFTVTDNGAPVATGTLARRPGAAQQRQIEARYPTCVWPGCRMPAAESDIDHRHPYTHGGRTDDDNLAPLSRHHHIVKEKTPWRVERLPNGDHRWTSPLGHVYIRKRDPPG